ncbi:MAG: DNA polymerase III subunit beta [Patescibacteria group bacterium]|nr:DNA polymerase III subunit beta [Patescibacteria group bacterium]
MNVVALKTNLKEGLSIISGARKESSNLPVLKNFLLETTDGGLKMSATDLEIGITHFVSSKNIEGGSVVIPYQIFSQIINNLSFERVNLELKKGNLLISTDNYKARITTVPKDDYPIIPQVERRKNNFFTIESGVFIESLLYVVPACQTSEFRPELSGVFFSFKDNQIKLVATDSFRLAEKTITTKKFETQLEKEVSFIIPLRTIQEVIKIFSSLKEGNIKIFFEENQVLFETQQTSIISRLIEGNFPDYEMVIPKSFETEIVLEKEDFINALKLTSSLSNRLNEVRFEVSDNLKNIKISSSSSEFGENEYLLPAKIKGSVSQITFNWKFLLDGIKNFKSEEIFWGLNGEEKASLIKAVGDQTFVYIVMPIRSS